MASPTPLPALERRATDASTLTNVTVDDFDPLIVYSDYTDWTTPDPQDNPTFYNASASTTGSPWHEATYHYTTVVGAKASLNFTGSSIAIYGAAGPSNTNYTITLDPLSSAPSTQSLSATNVTDGRTVLYSTDQLAYTAHTLEIVNTGSGLLLDLVVLGVQLGGSGATLGNTTVDDGGPEVVYSGGWSAENGSFYGGGSTYTQGPGNALSFSFAGSAVYLFGDQVNDHGPYSIYFNASSSPYATLTGRSGCGGGYAKACEKLGGLKFFANDLPYGTHNLTLVNGGPASGNMTFFDFDYAVYTTPSVYSAQSAVAGSCPFANCSSADTSGSAGSSSSTGTGTAAAAAATKTGGAIGSLGISDGLLVLVLGVWGLRRCLASAWM